MFRSSGIYKNILAMLIDISVAFMVCMFGLYLRMGTVALLTFYSKWFIISGYFCIAALISSIVFNVYRDIWSYYNMQYVVRYFKYSSLTSALFTIILFLVGKLDALPRSVLLINWLLLLFAIIAIRMCYKYIVTHSFSLPNLLNVINASSVVIVGSGPRIERFIAETSAAIHPPYKVVGIIEATSVNFGRRLAGIPVLGGVAQLKNILDGLIKAGNKPTRLILDSHPEILNLLPKIMSITQDLMIPISRFSNITELSHNIDSTSMSTLRPIALEDLLARPQRHLDFAKISQMIGGKTVMVTGAGGSIGSEIVTQCCKYGAEKIILIDSSEFLLYEIDQLCKRRYPQVISIPKLLDVRDAVDCANIFAKHKPQIVFHAAALKHVPLMEEHKVQALDVNVIGTFNIVRTAQEHDVQNLVFISTDKAVSPLSFMGISKRIAEILCQALASHHTKINIVRFGNVLGSNGSVVPLFEKQIEAGGPVTVTHPETTRYFMTIPEAVGLVLQASTVTSQEMCNTYILDMGQPVKILDLAEKMISLSGLRPYTDIQIEFTGLRPGEKLHENLCLYNDKLKPTEFESIFYTLSTPAPLHNINQCIQQLQEAIANKDEASCLKIVDVIMQYDAT
jgi:FlaA1/EpsC-like NDP-sugar epimerase